LIARKAVTERKATMTAVGYHGQTTVITGAGAEFARRLAAEER
jgi:hypothetical protein